MGLNIQRYEPFFVLKLTQFSKTHLMENGDKVAFDRSEDFENGTKLI